MGKRYFSIQDVARITGISTSKLRYAEKRLANLNINKIRNRRYYSLKDVENLLSSDKFDMSIGQFKACAQDITSNIKISSKPVKQNFVVTNPAIVERIDILLSKFQNVLEEFRV